MYRVKEEFDTVVAKRLQRASGNALVGMYTASLKSFEIVQRQGGLAALHFVKVHRGRIHGSACLPRRRDRHGWTEPLDGQCIQQTAQEGIVISGLCESHHINQSTMTY